MSDNYKITYNVDIVFCIDATASMTGIIDKVKENAINFYSDVERRMKIKGKKINKLRTKVIVFRDYIADGDQAMLQTDFYTLPEQSDRFNNDIRSIRATGGGDEPEDGLEALAFAIRSKWTTPKPGTKRRHIIVVWSDASTHPLGFGSSEPNYPEGMPKDFNELTQWWGGFQSNGYMEFNSKRLLLFTPNLPGWSDITSSWNQVAHYQSVAGNGLGELDYSQILDIISNSI